MGGSEGGWFPRNEGFTQSHGLLLWLFHCHATSCMTYCLLKLTDFQQSNRGVVDWLIS